ncbi:hypothetical protein I317_04658 [Kwoniella heveanensis CBS 569]|nr:hypothetical protein I317_04658 [Kwoniella heveanensis CBS 569]
MTRVTTVMLLTIFAFGSASSVWAAPAPALADASIEKKLGVAPPPDDPSVKDGAFYQFDEFQDGEDEDDEGWMACGPLTESSSSGIEGEIAYVEDIESESGFETHHLCRRIGGGGGGRGGGGSSGGGGRSSSSSSSSSGSSGKSSSSSSSGTSGSNSNSKSNSGSGTAAGAGAGAGAGAAAGAAGRGRNRGNNSTSAGK